MVRLSSAEPSQLIDMALNHGTHCSPAALAVLRRHTDSTCLRFYGPGDDGVLRAAIAEHLGVSSQHVLVANGSGPLLKSVIPYLVEARVRSSLTRMTRHVLFKRGYPLIVTSPTYSKVPASAHRIGLALESIALVPERGFELDVRELRRRLQQRDGLAYLCNPNNPTGNRLIDRAALEPLLAEFPRSFFFVDEAYVDYLEPSRQPRLADLTERYENLLILRSFSFAHGLAGAHVGYAITSPELVRAITARATPHVVSRLSADLAVASLGDPSHLARVRAGNAHERMRLTLGMLGLPGFEVYDSETNFIYARLRIGRSAADLARAMLRRRIIIKTFEPVGDTPFDEYCRFTVGLPEENDYLLEQLAAEVAERASPTRCRTSAPPPALALA